MGVPFLFGVIPVLLAILFACCIKDKSAHGDYNVLKKRDSDKDNKLITSPS